MLAGSLLAILFAAATASATAIPANAPLAARAANPAVITTCKNSGQVALTFDDGPYFNTEVRNSLKGNKGTFFLNGNNYACIYDRADDLKAMYAAGHTMGNHGWSHKHMGQLTWDQAHDELWRVEQAMIKILGVKPLYFRPPYGEMSDTLLAVLANRGYKKVFLWSDDSGDSVGASLDAQRAVYTSAAASFPKPHIVLNHETHETTPSTVVPYAVSKLTAAGYKLVAVDTCMGSDGEWPYQYVGAPSARDSSWHC